MGKRPNRSGNRNIHASKVSHVELNTKFQSGFSASQAKLKDNCSSNSLSSSSSEQSTNSNVSSTPSIDSNLKISKKSSVNRQTLNKKTGSSMKTIGNKTKITKKTKTSSDKSDVINENHSTKHTISTKRSLLNDNPIRKLKTTKSSKLSTENNKSKKKQKIDVKNKNDSSEKHNRSKPRRKSSSSFSSSHKDNSTKLPSKHLPLIVKFSGLKDFHLSTKKTLVCTHDNISGTKNHTNKNSKRTEKTSASNDHENISATKKHTNKNSKKRINSSLSEFKDILDVWENEDNPPKPDLPPHIPRKSDNLRKKKTLNSTPLNKRLTNLLISKSKNLQNKQLKDQQSFGNYLQGEIQKTVSFSNQSSTKHQSIRNCVKNNDPSTTRTSPQNHLVKDQIKALILKYNTSDLTKILKLVAVSNESDFPPQVIFTEKPSPRSDCSILSKDCVEFPSIPTQNKRTTVSKKKP